MMKFQDLTSTSSQEVKDTNFVHVLVAPATPIIVIQLAQQH